MVEFVPIYHKLIDANAHPAIPVKIVKRKKMNAVPIHVQHVLCAKMNQVAEITHAFVEVAIPVAIVM